MTSIRGHDLFGRTGDRGHTATPGGGLLGDLLCSLSDLLGARNPNSTAILTVLRNIVRVIGGLIG